MPSKSFVVENLPGAGGTVGTLRVVGAAPDGYTLLFGTVGNTINASYANLSFDFLADLVPIVMVAPWTGAPVSSRTWPVRVVTPAAWTWRVSEAARVICTPLSKPVAVSVRG